MIALSVAMIVVALLHFFALRSPEYLLYVATCGMVLAFLAQIGGYGFMYLWPEAPGWNQVAPILFMGGVQLAHLAFTIRLLDLRRRARYEDVAFLKGADKVQDERHIDRRRLPGRTAPSKISPSHACEHIPYA